MYIFIPSTEREIKIQNWLRSNIEDEEKVNKQCCLVKQVVGGPIKSFNPLRDVDKIKRRIVWVLKDNKTRYEALEALLAVLSSAPDSYGKRNAVESYENELIKYERLQRMDEVNPHLQDNSVRLVRSSTLEQL